MIGLIQDFRYAVRGLIKSPGFATVALLTLALGVGANAAVFSVVNAVLLRPLPYNASDRIVTLNATVPGRPPSDLYRQISIPDFRDWQAESSAFDAMAYYSAQRTAMTIGTSTEYAQVAGVSPEFFRVFDAQPVFGRLFTSDEVKPGSTGAAVVGHAFARRYFGDAVRAVGQPIRVFGRSVSIVGVLPAWFDFPIDAEMWFPNATFGDPSRAPRGQRNFLAVGRRRADASLERAQAELSGITARLEQQYPASNKGRGLTVSRLHDEMVGDVRLMLYVLLMGVGVVLLIACANLATLLLARATARTQEIAIRSALGASRGRVIRQLFAEGGVLALISGAAGAILAVAGTRALVALAPGDVPRLDEVTVDARVLMFTLAVSLAAGLLLALVPALQTARINLEQTLRKGGTRGTVSGRKGYAREMLVSAQLALSVVLLATGGLLIKSFVALQQVPLGFRPENVLVADATVRNSNPKNDATLFFRDLLREVSAMSGVVAAGATMAPPGRIDSDGSYHIDYLPKERTTTASQAVLSVIAPGTFAALGIPLVRGRDFHDGDTLEGPRTAIVNEALVRQALPRQDPIGRRIFCSFDSQEPMTIVGIVGDVRQQGPVRETRPECYMPYLQHFYNGSTLSLVVRSTIDSAALATSIRRHAQDLAPDVPLRFTTMEALLDEHVATPRFRALLIGLFAVVALCLAIIGIFGVTAYVVSQRTTEFGLRMALGASPSDVVWLSLKRGLIITTIGLATGLVAAGLTTRLIGSLLFEVKPFDPMTYLMVVGLLGLASLTAIYIPSQKSAEVDPLVALRYE